MSQQTLPVTADLAGFGRDLGAGTVVPTAGPSSSALRRGDAYYHNGLGCLLLYTGAGWRQAEIPTVATAAARTAISTSYAAALYTGFRVRQADTSNTWEWNATSSAWSAVPDHTFPIAQARQTVVQTGLGVGWQNITFNTTDVDSHGGFAGTTYTVPAGQGGTYAIEGAVLVSPPSAAQINAQIRKNGGDIPASYANWQGSTGIGAVGTGRHLVPLVPGDQITLRGYCSVGAWATLYYPDGGCYLAVERVR